MPACLRRPPVTTDTRLRQCLAALLSLSLLGGAAQADSLLAVDNQGILARSFALPALGDSRVLSARDTELRLALDWTNEYFADSSGPESLLLDGETERLTLSERLGLGRGLDAELEVPVLATGGGFLDGPIQAWHHFFGLPNGGRQYAPEYRYLVHYQRGDQTILSVDAPRTGVGDIQLSGGWQAAPDLALRAMFKLPTGNSDQLMGGNPGGALWVDYNPFGPSKRWFGFVSTGVSLNARGQVLSQQQQIAVFFGGAGAAYRPWRPFSLMVQLYGHSHLYDDSSLKALRREGLQLAIGGRYLFSEHTAVNLGFQEDLVTDSSPDISFHLDLVLTGKGP